MCEAEPMDQQISEIQSVLEEGGEDLLADSYSFPYVFGEFTTFVECAGLQPTWEAMDLGIADSATTFSSLPETEQLKQQRDLKPSAAMKDGDRFAELNPCRKSELTCNTSRSQVPRVWQVSESERQDFSSRIDGASFNGARLQLTSKHTLTRYFQSYADGFHKHFPLLHLPTYSIGTSPPELSLALAAIGAQYRFEFKNGTELYNKANNIFWERLSQCRSHASLSKAATHCECGSPSRISTIILLMAFSSWMQDPRMHIDALRLQAPLAHALNQMEFQEPEQNLELEDWESWIYKEQHRRAKLIGFAYLNVQCLIYDTPPLVFANTIDVLLPFSAAEWAAANESDWQFLRVQKKRPASFQGGFSSLLRNQAESENPSLSLETSPLALFILLQGILQKINLAQQSKIAGDVGLPSPELELLECVHPASCIVAS
jgi:hypothetical protein